jgi:16S rRNA (uracil1498-N3)-methyltransferase
VSIHLYLGYLKDKQRRKWVVEKATELGIDSIQILDAEYSASAGSASYKPKDVKWEADDQDKHALHAIEAAEQSERLTVPSIGVNLWSVDTEVAEEVAQTTTTEGGGDEIDSNERHLWLVCLERSETSPPILTVLTEELAAATATTKTIVHLLVGPEGGWSPTELQAFSNLGIMSVSLGSSVLRAETAAITAVAAVAMFFETTTVK